jgi:hypothetical protein
MCVRVASLKVASILAEGLPVVKPLSVDTIQRCNLTALCANCATEPYRPRVCRWDLLLPEIRRIIFCSLSSDVSIVPEPGQRSPKEGNIRIFRQS